MISHDFTSLPAIPDDEVEVRFQVAFETSPIGVQINSPDGRWLQANDAMCALLGYSLDELRELTIFDITHPDDLKTTRERYLNRMEGSENAQRVEKRYIRADGSVVWVALSSTVVRDDAGKPLYTTAHIEDITERHHAQAALAEAEERFRRAFDGAPIGMAMVAIDGRWLRVNRALCELTGYSESEMLKLTFQEITHPDDLERDLAQGELLLSGEADSIRVEKRYVRPDKSTVWLAVFVSLVLDTDGSPLYYVCQYEDIGDRKRAQQEAERSLSLEREHVERLRAVDSMKDEFVASVSHELRTPLTSIQGYVELLLDETTGELNDDQSSFLATIGRNSARLARLVNDLLFIAGSDAGRLELDLRDIDLRTLVMECVETARPHADDEAVTFEISADAMPMSGDPVRLGQLLDNLVSNAVKFTPKEGRVRIDLVRCGTNAVLEVSDNGIGIPHAQQGKLFERFFRSTLATESAIQGTGLGLSIAKEIAESHGGTIGFTSTEGQGTTFRVELPLASLVEAAVT
jgi:two-component system, sensor histidine kinase and response regulator